jgi:hypothetical protein
MTLTLYTARTRHANAVILGLLGSYLLWLFNDILCKTMAWLYYKIYGYYLYIHQAWYRHYNSRYTLTLNLYPKPPIP